MKYQNCIFDLYGTLVDIRTDERLPRLWEQMVQLYGKRGASYTPQALEDAYFSTVRALEAQMLSRGSCTHPEIRIEQVFRRLFWEKGVQADLAQAIQTGQQFRLWSRRYLRLYDGAAELLKALRANGQRVWLLSNAQRIFTAGELQTLGIDGLFDGIYLSSDYGCKKPDRRFFEILLQERGINPDSAIMIGNDGACDIQGANAVGLSTAYIRSNLSPAEPLPEADIVLEEMDLPRLQKLLTDQNTL